MRLEEVIANEIRFALPTMLENKNVLPDRYDFHGPYIVEVYEDAEMRHPITGRDDDGWVGEGQTRPVDEEKTLSAIYVSIERAHGFGKKEKKYYNKALISKSIIDDEGFDFLRYICYSVENHFDEVVRSALGSIKAKPRSEVAQ